MASRAPRFLLGYLKWFIVPVCVGLLGYYVVGPRLSQMNSPLLKNIDKLKPMVGASASEPGKGEAVPVLPDEPKKKLPDPQVQVSVGKSK